MPITLSGTNGVSGVDGTAGTPAVRGGDANTGIVYGADTVSIVTGGTERVQVNSSGQTLVPDGSAAAPAITNSGDENTGIFFPAADTIAFTEGGVESARFDSSGYFLVNTTNNALYGSAAQGNFNATGNVAAINGKNANRDFQTLGLWNAVDWSSGQTIYFAEFSSGVTKAVRGSITFTGTNTLYNATSDMRLKTNIKDADSAMMKISQVKVRNFDWIEAGVNTPYGFVAQELAEVIPEAVTKGDDNDKAGRYWQVDNSVVVPYLVKAIQELSAKLDAAEARIAALEPN